MSATERVDITLDDVTLDRIEEDDRGVTWKDYGGEVALPSPGGGDREAALLVEVAVDGAYTCFYGQHVDRVILDRVLEDLKFLIEQLDQLYPKDQPRGRCWERDGHEGDHRFPKPPGGRLVSDVGNLPTSRSGPTPSA